MTQIMTNLDIEREIAEELNHSWDQATEQEAAKLERDIKKRNQLLKYIDDNSLYLILYLTLILVGIIRYSSTIPSLLIWIYILTVFLIFSFSKDAAEYPAAE